MAVTPRESLVDALHARSNQAEASDAASNHVESRLWKVTKLQCLLDAVSDELDKDEKRLLALKARHKNSGAPINRLPDEVLGQIFHLFRPSLTRDEPISSTRPGIADKLTALRAKFCAVCSHWRDFIVADATMWNVLHLAMNDSIESADYINWARLQLDRSRGAPLDLSVSLLHPAESCQPLYYALLREHLPRCQRLAVLINYHIGLRYLLLDLTFPALKTLKVRYKYDSTRHLPLPPATRTRIPSFTPIPACQTPILQCLTVSSHHMDPADILWDLYTSNHNTLRFLSVNTSSDHLKSLFDFLVSLTQLQHLSWNCKRLEDTEPFNLPPAITLPNLVSLSVQGNQPALESLHTPNIAWLEFYASGSEWDAYIRTLGQSSGSSDREPKAFKFPFVRFLHVSSGSMSANRAICDYIVPQLEHLEEVSFHGMMGSAVEHIIVERHRRNLPPLRAVSIFAPADSGATRRFIAPLLLNTKLMLCLYRQCRGSTNYTPDTWLELKDALRDLEGYDRIVFVDNKSKGPSTFTIGPWGEGQ
ncbi:hypothetical protein DL93DRAFT_2171916 [Clavulina sp. PMI_390]|nr:hypothetical protein DL93DRAFT_2171916 [Clavulina sp. PMI_390]